MPAEKYLVQVTKTSNVAQGVRELVLRSENFGLLPAFAPGAHVDLHLTGAPTRAYSLTNASGSDGAQEYVVAVSLAPESRGGSRFIHTSLHEGDRLEISAPRNLFAMADDTAPVLLIAGGIGITPLRAMARQRQALGLPWQLVYVARSRAHAAYASELAEYGESVRLHFDDEAGGPLQIDSVVANLAPTTHVYCCGPQSLMDAVREGAAGHPAALMHFESFGGNTPAASLSDTGFEVELARQKRVVTVAPGQSIIDCLESCGVVIPSVCREGICGACECTVLSGAIDHRDQVLSDTEKQTGQTMMICVSRARGDRLVLDV